MMRGASTILLPAGYGASKRRTVYPGAGFALAAAALAAQGFLPLRITPFWQVDLPLVVLVFLTVSRRSVKAGMLTGMSMGWVRDAVTHGPLGVFGITETVVGYAASAASAYVNIEHFGIRGGILALSFILHRLLLFLVRGDLLGIDDAFEPLDWIALAVFHGAVGLLLYPLFDKLKTMR